MPEIISGLLTTARKALVPLAVGGLVALASKLGIGLPEDGVMQITAIVSGVVGWLFTYFVPNAK